MRKEDYWIIFSKSGKIEDYLTYRAFESKKEAEGTENAVQHKGSHT